MFTGIIEEKGRMQHLEKGTDLCRIQIQAKKVLQGTKIGDSIAVNGVCLTVTHMSGSSFTADVMPETLHRSTLGSLKSGDSVNLERAMAADGRFGGHIVSGHIDGTGTVAEIRREKNAVWYRILAAPQLLRYIVEKGSIAIDGISLTVAEVTDQTFSVSVIPHTLQETILAEKKQGDPVNLENDIVAKYVEKLTGTKTTDADTGKDSRSGVTMEMLRRAGF